MTDSHRKALVIIPARLASSRLPEKPLQEIAGKALVLHVCDAASRARKVETVVVATDSTAIYDCVVSGGYKCIMTSPDHPTGTDRVAEAAGMFDHQVVINVQGDEPFLPPEAIDEIAGTLLDEPNLAMHTLAVPLAPDHFTDPNVVKLVRDQEGNALYFSRAPIPAQWKEPTVAPLMHVGIYGFQREALFRFVSLEQTPLELCEGLEQLRALENGMTMRVSYHPTPFHGVETLDDLHAARERMAHEAPGAERKE